MSIIVQDHSGKKKKSYNMQSKAEKLVSLHLWNLSNKVKLHEEPLHLESENNHRNEWSWLLHCPRCWLNSLDQNFTYKKVNYKAFKLKSQMQSLCSLWYYGSL